MQLLYTLQTRAWFCHCANSIIRLGQLTMMSGAWFAEKCVCLDHEIAKDKECVGTYNNDIVDPMEPSLRIILIGLIIVGTLLDLLCYKWRRMANTFIYLECLTRVVAMLIPNFASY